MIHACEFIGLTPLFLLRFADKETSRCATNSSVKGPNMGWTCEYKRKLAGSGREMAKILEVEDVCKDLLTMVL